MHFQPNLSTPSSRLFPSNNRPVMSHHEAKAML